MSHLPPNAAIFSPSVARAAASTAKDWNYVDSWLSSRFNGRTAPPFERNPDTLRALLALAALNETADEERDLLAGVEASALADLENDSVTSGRDFERGGGEGGAVGVASARGRLLDALEAGLSREGRAALDAMAAASVELGLAHPTAEALSLRLVDLHAQTAEISGASARVAVLRRHVDQQLKLAEELVADVGSDAYRLPADLAKLNLETQRRVKNLEAKLPPRDCTSGAAAVEMSGLTVEQVRGEEEAYLALLEQKKDLDAQLRLFAGLSPDAAVARQELESRRTELRQLTRRRDAVFEGLVERETPHKPRKPR